MGLGTTIRGDQVEKRFKLYVGDVEITSADNLIVQWGTVQKSKSAGTVTYSDGYWRFNLSEAETLSQTRSGVLCQVELIQDATKRQCEVFRDAIGTTIIVRGGDEA